MSQTASGAHLLTSESTHELGGTVPGYEIGRTHAECHGLQKPCARMCAWEHHRVDARLEQRGDAPLWIASSRSTRCASSRPRARRSINRPRRSASRAVSTCASSLLWPMRRRGVHWTSTPRSRFLWRSRPISSSQRPQHSLLTTPVYRGVESSQPLVSRPIWGLSSRIALTPLARDGVPTSARSSRSPQELIRPLQLTSRPCLTSEGRALSLTVPSPLGRLGWPANAEVGVSTGDAHFRRPGCPRLFNR